MNGQDKVVLGGLRARLQVDARLLRNLHHRLAHGGDKGLVNLLFHRISTRIGHLDGNGALLLVDVVGQFRLVEVAREHAQHALAKVGRDDERGVVLPCLDTFFGLLFGVHNSPAQLVVVLEFVDNLVTSIKLAHQIVSSTFVVIGDSDFDVLGVSVRIPIGNDVVPRIKRRNDAYADGDDKRDGIAEQSFDVALEDCEGFFHAEPSNHEFE